jgi:hypothetical protein
MSPEEVMELGFELLALAGQEDDGEGSLMRLLKVAVFAGLLVSVIVLLALTVHLPAHPHCTRGGGSAELLTDCTPD